VCVCCCVPMRSRQTCSAWATAPPPPRYPSLP
jgi:hypothetical protein